MRLATLHARKAPKRRAKNVHLRTLRENNLLFLRITRMAPACTESNVWVDSVTAASLTFLTAAMCLPSRLLLLAPGHCSITIDRIDPLTTRRGELHSARRRRSHSSRPDAIDTTAAMSLDQRKPRNEEVTQSRCVPTRNMLVQSQYCRKVGVHRRASLFVCGLVW